MNLKHQTYEHNKCFQCDYVAHDNKMLVQHVTTIHKREKSFQCSECDKAFYEKGNLTKHTKSVHRQEKSTKFSIPILTDLLSTCSNIQKLEK